MCLPSFFKADSFPSLGSNSIDEGKMFACEAFNQDIIDNVWLKAKEISEKGEELGFRKDACGAWIKRSEYGNRDSKYGWEIDHIIPVSKKGKDVISNLQPLHWRNNCSKGDSKELACSVTASGKKNVDIETGDDL